MLVRTDEPERLSELIVAAGGVAAATGADRLTVSGMDSRRVGRIAADNGIALIELVPESATLEEAFMEITRGDVEFHGSTASAGSR